MKSLFKLFIGCIFSLQLLHAQDSETSTYIQNGKTLEQYILKENLKRNLQVIASDDFEGRETGSEGIRKAADYISKEFNAYGIPFMNGKNDYFQEVMFTWIYWDEAKISVNGETFRHLWDFLAFQDQNQDMVGLSSNEVVFLGYGIDDERYSDYTGVDVEGKVVLIYKTEPIDSKGNYWLTGTSEPSEWNNNVSMKTEAAHRHGAKLVLVIEDEIRKVLDENRRFLIGPKVLLGPPEENAGTPRANSCLVSTKLAKAVIGDQFDKLVKVRDRINKKGKPQNLLIPVDITVDLKKRVQTLNCNNILAFTEGSDPQLKDEVIILSAHYDHLGKRGDDIFNGADDNGSGTVTVMEITRAIALGKSLGKGPKRSVLTLLVTGEEKGLLGSQYYANNPIFPLENTVANVNIDMVGRIDDIYKDNPNYIYVIGADKLSTNLHEINEDMNNRFVGLELDYTYNDENDPNRYYYRSDHYNFAVRGIPAVFYFNGTHEDYHRPGDTVDKINFAKMEKIGRLAFWVVWELANRSERIEVDVKSGTD